MPHIFQQDIQFDISGGQFDGCGVLFFAPVKRGDTFTTGDNNGTVFKGTE